ncbi:GNAT family N-acetyltransferase [Stackebrandtia sp.]|uniref:GNAT family N-acetyltransferase n=1 Tax=Stackebrandtia sp. TaxID=2023065 RepID=UPI0039C96233
MTFIVRAYEPRDAEATWQTFLHAVRQTASADYTPRQILAWAPDTVDADAWNQTRSRAHTFVATIDDRVVGFGDVTATGLVDMLFVHPDAGGRGVARVLVDAVIGKARELGLERLHTHASRTARPVFERFGFVVDRANPDNRVRGEVVPNFDMHLDLGA